MQKKKDYIKVFNFIERLKYYFFLKFFNKKKKLLWTIVNNSLKNLVSVPTISVLEHTIDSSLGKKGEKIFVTNDSYQTWYVMNDKKFNQRLIDKLRSIIIKNIEYNLVDIGANTGLLTKCVLNNFTNIKQSFLIEPNKDNFFCAKNNLINYKNINLFNFALDVTEGEKKLFIDKNNKGNLSFNYEMLTFKKDKLNFMNSENDFEIIKCKKISTFFSEINNNFKNIIKIDVQGYDEIIFQEIPNDTLKKTDIVMIEITPLNTKKFDLEKFSSKIKYFNKFSSFEGKEFSIKDLIDLTKMKSGESIDILMYKENE